MRRLIVLLFLIIYLQYGCNETPVEPVYTLYKDPKFKKLIILKADDFKLNNSTNVISYGWNAYIKYIISENIKSSIGIIGNSLESGDKAYFSLIKNLNGSGSFEFWNHGYTHTLNQRYSNGVLYDEFKNTGLRYQISHLQKTQDLGEEKLNIKFLAFGAPGNAIDKDTQTALDSVNDIKIWFYGLPDSNKLVLKREADAEYPDGNPDFMYFINHYKVTEEYVVLQLHPNQWNESRFYQFKTIISFLKYNECTFILPSEYEKLINEFKKNHD